jgi:heme exporter protein CcmD
MNLITDFLYMGGYAFYVWTSYCAVIAVLFLQWYLPWRRWQKYLNE